MDKHTSFIPLAFRFNSVLLERKQNSQSKNFAEEAISGGFRLALWGLGFHSASLLFLPQAPVRTFILLWQGEPQE